jgi:hypothetical protein
LSAEEKGNRPSPPPRIGQGKKLKTIYQIQIARGKFSMARKPISARMEKVLADIEKLNNQKKQLEQEQKAEARKARTKRLIERGAILESLIDGAESFTNEQIQTILKRTVGSSYGVKIQADVRAASVAQTAAESANPPMPNAAQAAAGGEQSGETPT